MEIIFVRRCKKIKTKYCQNNTSKYRSKIDFFNTFMQCFYAVPWVFNTSLRTQRMLMHRKTCLIPINIHGVLLGLRLIAWLFNKILCCNVYLEKKCAKMYSLKSRANEPTFSKNERKCALSHLTVHQRSSDLVQWFYYHLLC